MHDDIHTMYPMSSNEQTSVRHMLSVSDVERLAKAGVQIKLEDVINQLIPDPVVMPPAHTLADLIYSRMKQSMQAKYPDNDVFAWHRPELHATIFKDKAYVFVTTGKSEPLVIEDDAHIFPSDALMAKLHLLQETERGLRGNDPSLVGGGVSQQGSVRDNTQGIPQQPLHRLPNGKLVP